MAAFSPRALDSATSYPQLNQPVTPAALEQLAANYGTPLLMIDCERVRSNYRRLKSSMPRVAIHYAMKALPLPEVVATLDSEGSCFDVATMGEIEIIKALGIDAARCVHTHPIKKPEEIESALAAGVTTFVVDNPDEIHKFHDFRDGASVMIRIGFGSNEATVDLSKKFGCPLQEVDDLVREAQSVGVPVAGLAVHAGSQPKSSDSHVRAIKAVIEKFLELREEKLRHMHTLDIGGGFPTTYKPDDLEIETFCEPISRLLEQVPQDVRVISEPGRYLVASAGTCLIRVVGRAKRNGRWWYYIDDGLYGSFSGQVTEPTVFPVDSLKQDEPRQPSVLTGPTCDGFDTIAEEIALPELSIGDLIVGQSMGAYTAASATDFNLVPRARILPVNFDPTHQGQIPPV
jgi:ornithine decarboxylase